MKAIGNRRKDALDRNSDFQVANLSIPVLKTMNNNERQTVLRKGHLESLQALLNKRGSKMSRIRRIVIAGALAVASVVPLTVAEAMPVTNAPAKAEKATDVQQARWCGRWRCGYRRAWRPRARIWVRPRIWVGPRVVVRPRYVVRSGYNRHVRWCLNNYRSYEPSSNTFVDYNGNVRRCRSPYR